MPVPKYRKSKSARDKRRSHHFLTPPNLTGCAKCGEPLEPHRVCNNCGTYKGKKVIQLEA